MPIFISGSAATKYTLNVDGFTGNLRDALKEHNKRSFSTFDVDNDGNPGKNCGFLFRGGWWFRNYFCYKSHLNGLYYSGGKMGIDVHNKNIPATFSGIHWLSHGFNEWDGRDSLLFTEMKVRRKISSSNDKFM